MHLDTPALGAVMLDLRLITLLPKHSCFNCPD